MKKIQWNKVTWYSKLIAVILFLAVFAWGFYLGRLYEQISETQSTSQNSNSASSPLSPNSLVSENLINNVSLNCNAGKTIQAQFLQNNIGQGAVAVELSDGRSLILPQTISADGARYAKPDESFVFWNKGNSSFVEEGMPYATSGQKTTYSGCAVGQ